MNMASAFDRIAKLHHDIDRQLRRARGREIPDLAEVGRLTAMKARARDTMQRLTDQRLPF
ncbi:hypothetical protein [Sphingomicrobium aestuariivivum]|uniref:hypothetical protein n=1 Tax=Sphingomicrobium aestuariivivum TaxID=1582356 RepID=UPI001FD63D10|nr:hypothetical protein [Sphingomicrobium aestuariivivum]MCJ8190856.1 hypothetical protein [Sphingomicrobium aestuariivivum]